MKRTSAIGLALGLATGALALVAPSSGFAKPYKGGEILSSQTYLYGRMEMRMRMARGSGILSTFFTYKDGSEIEGTFWEEIDIEVFGKDDARTWQSNIITGVGTRTTSEGDHEHPTSLADDYHTYALEWTPDYVAWELDGVEVRRTTGGQVSDLTNPQSLRFNLWAANIESWVGPFDTSALPQYQYVNWIKYYRYEGGQFVHEWTDDFDAFDAARWSRADWTFGENLVDFDPNNVLVQEGTLILALTLEGQTGFNGSVPVDSDGSTTDDTTDDVTSEDSTATSDDTSDDTGTSDDSTATTTTGATDTTDTTTAATTDDSAATGTTDSTTDVVTTNDSDATATTGTTDDTTSTSDDDSTAPNTTGTTDSTTTTGTTDDTPPTPSTNDSPTVDTNPTTEPDPSGVDATENTDGSGSPTLPDGATGGVGTPAESADDTGCSCRLPSNADSSRTTFPLLALGLTWWLRRRKLRPSHSP